MINGCALAGHDVISGCLQLFELRTLLRPRHTRQAAAAITWRMATGFDRSHKKNAKPFCSTKYLAILPVVYSGVPDTLKSEESVTSKLLAIVYFTGNFFISAQHSSLSGKRRVEATKQFQFCSKHQQSINLEVSVASVAQARMMDGYPAADGLRRRRGRQEAGNGELPSPAAAEQLTPRQLQNQLSTPGPAAAAVPALSVARLYYCASVILFIVAVVAPSGSVAPSAGARVFSREPAAGGSKALLPAESASSRHGHDKRDDDDFDFFKAIQELFTGQRQEDVVVTPPKKAAPAWIRWLLPPQKVEPQQAQKGEDSKLLPILAAIMDPTLLHLSPNTPTDIIDKILKSTERLLVIANFLLVMTYLTHGAVAGFFLGSRRDGGDRATWAGRERLGAFLVFKLLLISAVVIPDTLDLLILLGWYTLLSFLRSLAALASATTSHTSLAGQPPKPGVLQLLVLILMSDVFAAALCAGLFHGAGWGMVLLLTCDCALLAVDVICHILRHVGQGLEEQHSSRIASIEDRQLALHELRREAEGDENSHTSDDLDELMEESRRLDRRMEVLETRNAKRGEFLETVILMLQLLAHALTVCHFLHIWSLHGLQFTLIDGVLALHLHSAFSTAGKKIADRRKLNQIARDLDGLFDDANEMELRKAAATGDVCCICMGTMSTGNIKKVGCGHMYHTHCLREVVERARSIEATRCPLCRASVLDGTQPENTRNSTIAQTNAGAQPAIAATTNLGQTNNAENDHIREAPVANLNAVGGGEHALFRFSTVGLLPTWLPLPAFSFEVVRRPTLGANPIGEDALQDPRQRQSVMRRLLLLAGVVSMTPDEEAVVMEQLVDMFPQYDRADLLRELRARGSAEDVVESVVLGSFLGTPRGGGMMVDTTTTGTTAVAPTPIIDEQEQLNEEAEEWERVSNRTQELEEETGNSDDENDADGINASDNNDNEMSEHEANSTHVL